MPKLNKNELSPLVQAVLALDESFSELTRLSEKLDETELKSESDLEQVQRLMNLFAEVGQNVSEQVLTLSATLNDARGMAEAAAQKVSARAEQFQAVQTERQKKMEEFRLLGEKVHALTASLSDLKRPEGEYVSDEERARMSMRLSQVELELRSLIEGAQGLKVEAQASKMKKLEQGAHSLSQSLLSVSQKLHTFQQQAGQSPRQ